MKGRKWILTKHFQGSPKEGDLDLVEFDVPEIKDGGKLRKFKGGICCGGHLAVRRVIIPPEFFVAKPSKQFR